MSRRLTWILLAVVVALVGGGATLYWYVDDTIRDAYAVWWVAYVVIEHMEQNDGAWPRSWDELRPSYEALTERSGRPWSLENLRNRVEVDFTADVETVRQDESLRVIRLRDGSDTHWERHEPNTMVRDYLRGQRAPRPI